MKLSRLQKFILVDVKNYRQKQVPRREFLKYYNNINPSTRSAPSTRLRDSVRSGSPLRSETKPSKEDQHNIITKSLMRLIRKDMLVGFGEITKEKIFVERVRLTRMGTREVRRLLDKQQKLPLKMKRKKK